MSFYLKKTNSFFSVSLFFVVVVIYPINQNNSYENYQIILSLYDQIYCLPLYQVKYKNIKHVFLHYTMETGTYIKKIKKLNGTT